MKAQKLLIVSLLSIFSALSVKPLHAQSCTEDKISGTYTQSCTNCSVNKHPQTCSGPHCDQLECQCNKSLGHANGTGILLETCPSCQFWNDHGTLKCGNG
jgi:hypothetical protein